MKINAEHDKFHICNRWFNFLYLLDGILYIGKYFGRVIKFMNLKCGYILQVNKTTRNAERNYIISS